MPKFHVLSDLTRSCAAQERASFSRSPTMGSTITIEIPDAIKLAMRRRSGRPYMTVLALVSPSLHIVAVSGHEGKAIMKER